MTEDFRPVTKRLLRYLAAHTVQEDDFLRALKSEALEEGLPPIWIAPEQGSLMQILLKLTGAHEIVEVGTLAGYSAIWMARALPEGGRVRTIEISARHADFAERWIARSDVAGRIRLYRGAGRDILPKFKTGSADAAFLDADKANYRQYLKEVLRIVRSGGLIMVDNAFAFGQLLEENPRRTDVGAVRAFNEIMAKESALQSIIVPIGDGLWVGVKV
jgi:predicted O-methyltransferase YrrM